MLPAAGISRPIFAAFVAALAIQLSADGQDREGIDFFEKRIRPVLVEHCYECHSAQAKVLQGELRLDSREAMRKGGESGPALIPKQADASLILSALRHEDLKMPPGKKLAAPIIADFERWIDMGAPDPRDKPDVVQQDIANLEAAKKHWAFQPMRRPALPEVKHVVRVSSPIDRFVLAQVEKAGLTMSSPADRITLVRRAYFDLHGLPPSPEEVDAFLADDSPDAFARLVDRLLESPRYGERWGRYWLDVARYADNKGYVFFEEKKYPWAWTYRDYVIRALNEDLPFDRFVLEQLAADQLDLGEDRRPLAAMGFLTLGPRLMNNTHDILDDRIDVITRGLLGLTVTCARCHDHKFDPISQEDYYGLYGVMRSSVEPMLPPEFLPAEKSDAYQKFDAGMQERLGKLGKFIATQREQIILGARRRAAEYLLEVHRKRNHPDTENFMLLTDKGALNPAMVHRWEAYLKRARRARDPVWTVWHAFSAIPDEVFSARAGDVHKELMTGKSATKINPLVRRAFENKAPEKMKEVAQRYGELLAEIEKRWQQFEKKQPDGGGDKPRRLPDDAAEALRQVLYGAKSPPMIPREMSWGFLDLLPDRPTQGEYKKLLKEVETWAMKQPGAPPRAMVLGEAESPYDPVVFMRGNPNRKGRSVTRRYPTFFSTSDSKPFGQGSGRLELARRIVDPKNPLTARVLVNRVWMHHFGQGLVKTPSDFGLRSDPPSHPELLDWLATKFIDDGWSLKELHRTIMNSAVYQQASHGDRNADVKTDPENRLLSFFPRRRLDFEAMRDSLLSVSGSMDRTVGGPAVDIVNGFNPRRSVYGFVNRMDLPGLMRSFDFPEPAATSPRRDRTTVAPQALFFMNHQFTEECATKLLRRSDIASIADADERVIRTYRVLFSRTPDDDELKLAQAYLQQDDEKLIASAWNYGYGGVDDSDRVTGFTELRHWTGQRWQGGPKLPDPKLGWVFVDRNGGHPAATLDRSVIRRWTAPASGKIKIDGTLKHHPPQGNGVRARIISSRSGELGQWKAHHSEAKVGGVETVVEAGDTIDFVVDFNGEITHDEHEWPVTIRLIDAGQPLSWDSQRDFRGGKRDRWVDYVQALLMTNEFVFVD